MKAIVYLFILVVGMLPTLADTVKVTVGDTGCPGRQLAVKHLWEKIPCVTSVTVLPRQQGDVAASRVFVIVTKGPSPDSAMLRSALARRAERYPILSYQAEVKTP